MLTLQGTDITPITPAGLNGASAPQGGVIYNAFTCRPVLVDAGFEAPLTIDIEAVSPLLPSKKG